MFGFHKDESKTIAKPNERAPQRQNKQEPKQNVPNNFTEEQSNAPGIDMRSGIIPKELHPNTKKFIEVKTAEVFYLTPDDGMYTEDKNGRLVKLDNLNSLRPQPNKSPNVHNIMNTKNKSSMSESQSTPMLNRTERSSSKHDNMNTSELFLNPFTNPVNTPTPFGMASPSVQNINFNIYDPYYNTCNQMGSMQP